jgi:hypothetical protein
MRGKRVIKRNVSALNPNEKEKENKMKNPLEILPYKNKKQPA